MNRAWHGRHPMPERATAEARLRWHLAHQNACGCRPIPASVLSALARGPSRKPRKTKKPQR